MRAPEFPNDLKWFNSEPLTMSGLKGKAVLIDFWTYSCVNCIRTLPYLKEWHKRYADKGFVIVGVHTPEFEFEKEEKNVSKALKDFEIAYPVVMDNDYAIWNLYANRFWPRKFLVNKEGKIVYDHAGEGNYAETEAEIQRALLEINPKLELPAVTEGDGSGGLCYPTTSETYLGSLRGRPGSVWCAEGAWKSYPEFIEHAEVTADYKDFISLDFQAAEVNLVMSAPAPSVVKFELDGKPYGEATVHESKLYNVIKPMEFMHGKLKILVKDKGVRAYAFTFGGCLDSRNSTTS